MSAELTRRNLLKAHAAGIAAATAGISLPAAAQPVPGGVESLEIKWSKAPCRFCGTGCGVMVGVKEGQVVATHGDMQAEVNRGLNCIKGYFLSKIMYGEDRLQTPLLVVFTTSSIILSSTCGHFGHFLAAVLTGCPPNTASREGGAEKARGIIPATDAAVSVPMK